MRLRTTSTQRNSQGGTGRRALLLPSGKEANGPQGGESAGAQYPAAWRASLPFDAEEARPVCQRARPSTPTSGMAF